MSGYEIVGWSIPEDGPLSVRVAEPLSGEQRRYLWRLGGWMEWNRYEPAEPVVQRRITALVLEHPVLSLLAGHYGWET